MPEHVPPAGSSPRERGTLHTRRSTGRPHRIIPARAGNADTRRGRTAGRPDHPRASGERSSTPVSPSFPVGSSPRERGTHPPWRRYIDNVRIIPARAGNASATIPAMSIQSDHPRASGERRPAIPTDANRSGSSPRERGTPRGAPARLGPVRIIPARAGNAGIRRRRQAEGADHPRASGERFSPGLPGDAFHRIIPARAGNACCRGGRARRVTDHPRASGERTDVAALAFCATGSSPRERGTRSSEQSPGRRRRIIPARAGNACRA